ncbi:transporter [Bacillus toyonensis]|nr:transporter [Bacillus toyonensis]PEE79362.1 transporter [Bacillus toyonensis]PFY82195.1 transporter [Bacillus toyonensis]PHG46736.1 transporter [Bacillus toyonensis]
MYIKPAEVTIMETSEANKKQLQNPVLLYILELLDVYLTNTSRTVQIN